MPVPIVLSPDLETSKGEFGARVEGESLLLPASLGPALRRLQVRNGEDLLSCLSTFPSAVAEALDWSMDETRQAESALIVQLRGLMHEAMLEPTATQQRHGFGALDPAGLHRTSSH